jgi:hypothetical protein
MLSGCGGRERQIAGVEKTASAFLLFIPDESLIGLVVKPHQVHLYRYGWFTNMSMKKRS